MLGSTMRNLITLSKMQGWDPTVVPGMGSISEFDRIAGLHGAFDGSLAKGAYAPDDSTADQQVIQSEAIDFTVPDVTREKPKYTNNSNPYPGFDGGY